MRLTAWVEGVGDEGGNSHPSPKVSSLPDSLPLILRYELSAGRFVNSQYRGLGSFVITSCK